MRTTRICFTLACCLTALTTVAQAQSKPKAGLWEVTSSMNMGGSMPQGAGGGPMAPHTTQVCVTQAMIDKFGGPYSNPPRGDCQVTDIALKENGMTASVACTGQMTGTGTVESTFIDGNSTQTKIHITGTMQMGPNSRPIDITMQSKSVYKGADCGSVKPAAMPASK
jgi:hypothetical protein